MNRKLAGSASHKKLPNSTDKQPLRKANTLVKKGAGTPAESKEAAKDSNLNTARKKSDTGINMARKKSVAKETLSSSPSSKRMSVKTPSKVVKAEKMAKDAKKAGTGPFPHLSKAIKQYESALGTENSDYGEIFSDNGEVFSDTEIVFEPEAQDAESSKGFSKIVDDELHNEEKKDHVGEIPKVVSKEPTNEPVKEAAKVPSKEPFKPTAELTKFYSEPPKERIEHHFMRERVESEDATLHITEVPSTDSRITSPTNNMPWLDYAHRRSVGSKTATTRSATGTIKRHMKKSLASVNTDEIVSTIYAILQAEEPYEAEIAHKLLKKFSDNGIADDDPRAASIIRMLKDFDLTDKALNFEEVKKLVSSSAKFVYDVVTSKLAIPKFPAYKTKVKKIYDEFANLEMGGHLATYIPQLANQNPKHFGVSICTVSGQQVHFGDISEGVSLHAISSVVSYCLAIEQLGSQKLLESYIGCEPSGKEFNTLSLTKQGRPHNPLINSGSMMYPLYL